MKNLISLFVYIILLEACTPWTIIQQLNEAELLLQEVPDSALSLLNGIDQSRVITKKDYAKYALLLSAALDKNYIDVTSDSLIRIATDYYAISHDLRRRMMSYYYLGIAEQNMKDYPAAITSLEKAEKDALLLSDYYYLGLIYRNKSGIYNQYSNNLTAIAYDISAISAFNKANKPSHKDYATLSLAIDYVNGRDFHKATHIIDSLELACSDSNLVYQLMLLKAEILLENNGDANESIRIYRETPHGYISYMDKAYWAVAYENIGQRDSSDRMIQGSYSMAKSKTDSATIAYMHSHIELARGNYFDAYNLVNNAALVQDSLTRVRLDQSMDSILREYYKSETALQLQKNRQMRERLFLTGIVSFLLILLLWFLFLLNSRKKDAQIKEYMAQFAARSAELNNAIKQNAFLVGSLFSERLYHLDELSEAYYANDNEATKEALFKEFKSKVFSLRDDERLFAALEDDLDSHCNLLMTKFREQVPKVKGENLKMVILYFAGFPYQTIQIILRKNSVASLRTAKSRIKTAILDAKASDAATFLKLLETEKKVAANQNK